MIYMKLPVLPGRMMLWDMESGQYRNEIPHLQPDIRSILETRLRRPHHRY
jgi:hypothetical protein